MTCDMRHMRQGTWHMTGDRWEEVNVLSKCHLPSSYSLGVTGDMWHLTCDTWHTTHDTWYVSHDTQGVVNTVSKFQVRCLNGLGVMMFLKYGGKEWQSKSINNKGFCRTAPDTQGLLKTFTVHLTVDMAVYMTVHITV